MDCQFCGQQFEVQPPSASPSMSKSTAISQDNALIQFGHMILLIVSFKFQGAIRTIGTFTIYKMINKKASPQECDLQSTAANI
jgi:hypothetical protein